MTRYEYLMSQARECFNKALNTTCIHLRLFYLNARLGFIHRANNLTIEEASVIVTEKLNKNFS